RERILRLARTMPKDDFAELPGKEFDSVEWENRLKRDVEGDGDEDFFDEETVSSFWKLGIKRSGATKALDRTRSLESRINEFIGRSQSLDDSVSRSVERFYFGKIREALREGIIKTEVEAEARSR